MASAKSRSVDRGSFDVFGWLQGGRDSSVDHYDRAHGDDARDDDRAARVDVDQPQDDPFGVARDNR